MKIIFFGGVNNGHAANTKKHNGKYRRAAGNGGLVWFWWAPMPYVETMYMMCPQKVGQKTFGNVTLLHDRNQDEGGSHVPPRKRLHHHRQNA